MSYFITFQSDRKPCILDNVKRFIFLANKTLVKYEDGTEEELVDLLGISAHFYHEG